MAAHSINTKSAKIRALPDYSFEMACRAQGMRAICGVDEVGRGAVAGPVVAAAVILDQGCIPEGINDSKKLTAKARARLAQTLAQVASIGIGWADEEEIAQLNIRKASHLAMLRAIDRLELAPDYALIDGRDTIEGLKCPAQAVVKGDGRSLSIAAASIIAKHHRDRLMAQKAKIYPHFGWEKNAGYLTKAHLQALQLYGPTQYHRKTFAPIHNMLCENALKP